VIPTATLAHCTSDRVRLRVHAKRGDASYFDRLHEALSQCPGIRQLDVNPLTGSVVLHHSLEVDDIAGFGRANDLFELDGSPDGGEAPLTRLRQAFAGIDGRLVESTQGRVDLATLGFALCVGGAVLQLARGNTLAPASTLVWYAASLLLLASALPSRPLPTTS
jgi:hypothetical protein